MTSKIVFHPTCQIVDTKLAISVGIYDPQASDHWKLHLVNTTPALDLNLYIKRDTPTTAFTIDALNDVILFTAENGNGNVTGLTSTTTVVPNGTEYNKTVLTIPNGDTAQLKLSGADYKIFDLLKHSNSTIELVKYTNPTTIANLTSFAVKTALTATNTLPTYITRNVNDIHLINTNMIINGYEDTTAGYWNNLATTIPNITFKSTSGTLTFTDLNIIPSVFTAGVLTPGTALTKTTSNGSMVCVFKSTGTGTPNLFNALLSKTNITDDEGYFYYTINLQLAQYTDTTNFEAAFGNTVAYVVKLTNTIDYYFGTMVFNLHDTTNNTILEGDFNLIQRPVFRFNGNYPTVITKFMFDSTTITDFAAAKSQLSAVVKVAKLDGTSVVNPVEDFNSTGVTPNTSTSITEAKFTYNYTNDKTAPYYTLQFNFRETNEFSLVSTHKMEIVISYPTTITGATYSNVKTYTVTLDKFTLNSYKNHCNIYNEPFIQYNKYIYHPIDNSSTTANPTILANIVLPNTDSTGIIYVYYNYNKFFLTLSNLNTTTNLPIATVTYNAANKSITLYNKVLTAGSAFADFGKLYISYETNDNQFFTHSFIVLPVKLDEFKYNIKDTGAVNRKMNITTFLADYLNKNETGMSATIGDATTYYYDDIPYISSKLSQIQYTNNTTKVYSEIKVPTDVYAANKTDVKVTPTTTGFNYWFLNDKHINYDITANSNFLTNYYSTYTHNAAAATGAIDTKLFIVNQTAFENNINYYSHLYLLTLFSNMPAPVLAADNRNSFNTTNQGLGNYLQSQIISQNAQNIFDNHLYRTYEKLSNKANRVPFITAVLGLILTAYQGTADNVYQTPAPGLPYSYPSKSVSDIINTLMYFWDIGVNKTVGFCTLEAEVASLFGATQYATYITRITAAINALNPNPPGADPYKFEDDNGYQPNSDLSTYFNLFFTPAQIADIKEKIYQHLYAYLNFIEVAGKNIVKLTEFKTKTYILFKALLTPDATKLANNTDKYNEYLQYITIYQTGTNAVIDVYDTFVRIGMSVASATGDTTLNTSTANTLPAIFSRMAAKTRGTIAVGGEFAKNPHFTKTNEFMYSYLRNVANPNDWWGTGSIKSDLLFGMISDTGFLFPLIGTVGNSITAFGGTLQGIFNLAGTVDITTGKPKVTITADNGINKDTALPTVLAILTGAVPAGVQAALGTGLGLHNADQAWTFIQFMNYLGNITDVLRNRFLLATIFSEGTAKIVNNLRNKNLLAPSLQPTDYDYVLGDFSLSDTRGWNIDSDFYSRSFNEFKNSTKISWSSGSAPLDAVPGRSLSSIGAVYGAQLAGYGVAAYPSWKRIPKATKISATDIKTASERLFGLTRASKADSIAYNTANNSKTYFAGLFPGTGGDAAKIKTSTLTSLTPIEQLAHTVVEPIIELISTTGTTHTIKPDYQLAELSLRDIASTIADDLKAGSPEIINAFNNTDAVLIAKRTAAYAGYANYQVPKSYTFNGDYAIAVSARVTNDGFANYNINPVTVQEKYLPLHVQFNFAPTVGRDLEVQAPNTNLIQVPVTADDTIVLLFIKLPSEVKINWSINKAPKISDNIKRCGDHLIVKWDEFPNAKYYCLYKYVGLCKEPIEKFTVRDTRYCDEIIKSDCSNFVRYKVQAITPQGATQLSEYATYLFKN